jgi:DNA-binding Xre family transcriptional regulator
MNIQYTESVIRWRLKETMDESGVTRYALQKESGVAMNTIRGMYDGSTQRPDLEVLDKVLTALRVLMKRSVGLTDVLQFQEV